jgi:hypothetical protein
MAEPYVALVFEDGSLLLASPHLSGWRLHPLVFHFNAFLAGRTGSFVDRERQAVALVRQDMDSLLTQLRGWGAFTHTLEDGLTPGTVAPWFRTIPTSSNDKPDLAALDYAACLLQLIAPSRLSVALRSGLVEDWSGTWVIPPVIRANLTSPNDPAFAALVVEALTPLLVQTPFAPCMMGQHWNWNPMSKAMGKAIAPTTYRSPGLVDLGFFNIWEQRAFLTNRSAHERLALLDQIQALHPALVCDATTHRLLTTPDTP